MTAQPIPSEQTHVIPRELLNKYFGQDPRLVRAFENQALAVMGNQNTSAATDQALDKAEIVTLSPNASFSNEHVLSDGDGTKVNASPGTLQIDVDASVPRAVNGTVEFMAPGPVVLSLPTRGKLLSDGEPPRFSGLINAASDSAAASAGVPIGGVYHNAGALRVRLS